MTVDTPTACPECDSALVTEEIETVCSECGLVVGEERIDPGPEWRSFEDDDTDRRRTGAPLSRSRHDYGLSTEIGYGGLNRATGRKRGCTPGYESKTSGPSARRKPIEISVTCSCRSAG